MQMRDAGARELMDDETLDADALRRNLADLRSINALLGWTAFTTRAVARHIHANGLKSFSLLDVASGSADIPAAIARRAAREGIRAEIVVTDVQQVMLDAACEHTSGVPGIRVERADALALPYSPGSFDIALCTLALHHFDPEQAAKVLANLARVGRQVLVFDVVRSRAAYAGSWLLTRALAMHPVTRHDAPMSVRRGYTASEVRALAARAGVRDARVRVEAPFRLALSARGTCFVCGKEQTS